MALRNFQRGTYAKLLASCLLPVTATMPCRVTECLDGSSCCESQSDHKVYLDYSWYGPLFICMLIVFSVLCLCGICNNVCRFRSRTEAPLSPRETPLIDMGAPPPYSEVAAKPYLYPPSEASPPSYSSVVQASPPPPVWGHQS
ncbi:transmembrane protein 92 [Hyperolius riggenbachi]|uniref:transmembrane protein 92 n=1 Tax=Hyperolius riggenbachi TaxID=752182 RepID=UPI0035A329F6